MTAADKAEQIVAGTRPLPGGEDLVTLVGDLADELAYGPAREVLALAETRNPADPWVVQQLALCTYKDEELPPFRRFDDALALLERVGLGAPKSADPEIIPPDSLPETLGLGGAIHKRLWEYRGQSVHLHQAYDLYRAAWDLDPRADKGYGGVNAAHLLDLLAHRAETTAARSGGAPRECRRLRREARKLRREILPVLAGLATDSPALGTEYWYQVTVAEVHFGLKQYPEATAWLERAAATAATEWQRQTTFLQLLSLARLQGHRPPREDAPPSGWAAPWRALGVFLGDGAGRALSNRPGKLGLALSGGGFRASFYHLGVLARLAELDVLRSVEVLSTVSGGSIVGAMYYLEVQQLLQTKADEEIRKQDYIDLVERVARRFLEGVQENIRMGVLAALGDNIRMVCSGLLPDWITAFLPKGLARQFASGYSRTHKLGALYDQVLYRKVADGRAPSTPRSMRELLVEPAPGRERRGFKPRFDNWRRRAKVPVLLLNTTSLNSGHNWHFTASWMGEPPGLLGAEVDKNRRYRRLYYDQAPAGLRDFPLGYAVAASSCVPGLFDPLAIEGLYEGHTVQLVDGGVHDNQGTQGLLDEGCTVIICSDASGQMEDRRRPGDGVLSVLLRTASIQGDRIRESEYLDLTGRLDSGALQGLCYVHMKKDLPVRPLDWVRCDDPTPGTAPARTTPYRVAADLQARLAAIRTDLDSFSEVEAASLMCSGYLTTGQECRELRDAGTRTRSPTVWDGFDVDAPAGAWPFLRLAPILGLPEGSVDVRRRRLVQQLDAAGSTAFKVWRLVPGLRTAAMAGAAAALVVAYWVIRGSWHSRLPFTVGGVLLSLGAGLVVAAFPLLKLLAPQKAARSLLSKLGLATFGWVVARVHLRWFDRLFLEQGTVDKLLDRKP